MDTPTTAEPTPAPTHVPDLRRRADDLAEFARSIERSIVMTLVEPEPATGDRPPPSTRDRLCTAMLERNLHQLHRAADDLRVTAMRFRERADELDRATRAAA